MKVYIAAAWPNKQMVRKLAAVLRNEGHEITHDWTHEKATKGWEQRAYRDDVRGVVDADALIMILPARRGAHVELGIAIGTGKKIIICMDTPEQMIEGYGCPFYWGPEMVRISGSFTEWTREVLRILHEMDIVAEISL